MLLSGASVLLSGASVPSVRRRTHAGYSIVELMVAITVGLIILAGLVKLFADNSRARAEIDRANQQVENGRYALQLLEDALHNAGYLALLNPAVLATPVTKPDPCDASLTGLQGAMSIAVQGYDDGAGIPALGCVADLRPNTDVLVIRRASTCAVTDAGCDPLSGSGVYLQTSACNSTAELASGNPATYYTLGAGSGTFSLHLKDCTTAAPLYQYRVEVYFIANDDKGTDGIPTLKRAEIGSNGAFSIVPLVEGVEDMQLEFGLDTASPTTGTPAVYTANPDLYNACTPAACMGYWRNVVAVKVNLLTRNTTTTPGYVDSKVYTLGQTQAGAANTVGPFGDAYKRHLYSAVIRATNTAGRNMP